jgi:AbrB family looped-hinge helix DNA binding protein
MATTSISTKGQVTLPVGLRRKLGLKPRDRVLVELRDGSIVISRAPDFFALQGFLGKALAPDVERRRMRKGVASHALVQGRDSKR